MSTAGPKLLASQQPCPYIQGKTETLFHVQFPQEPDLSEPQLKDALSELFWSDFASHGFRRQGRLIYRPCCDDCCACIATRVLVNEFHWKRRFRRIMRINEDLSIVPSRHTLVSESEAFELYAKYIRARHQDGSMYPPDPHTMRTILHLESDRSDFHLHGFLKDRLVFIAQTDQLLDGFSANYTIFDPDFNDRSLGTFAILSQIEQAAKHGLDYLYLGFALNSVKNMRYKKQFFPQERLINDEWVRFDTASDDGEAT